MPQYTFLSRACKKEFSKILTVSEHEKGKIVCPHLQEQGRRAAVGSLLCGDLEEELVRLSLWDHISARETPVKEKWARVTPAPVRQLASFPKSKASLRRLWFWRSQGRRRAAA